MQLIVRVLLDDYLCYKFTTIAKHKITMIAATRGKLGDKISWN